MWRVKIEFFVFASFMLAILFGCQKDDYSYEEILNIDKYDNEHDQLLYHDQPVNEGVANALAKARMIAGIEWTPLAPVPNVYGKTYSADVTKRGLPYSLAQKVNGYVGLDVSFYTFLTAVNNPYSVLYTENLATRPYDGFDCAPYYGSVCSTSVWYALGINVPYYTSSIHAISTLKKCGDLGVDSISLCDVLWSKGHVAMVYDITRDSEGRIMAVSVFETTRVDHADSRIISYTYNDFCQRWDRVGWVIYRHKNLSENLFSEASLFNTDEVPVRRLFEYNFDICTSRGDRVAYAAGENVTINVLSNRFSKIELYRDGSLYEERAINSTEESFMNLPYGDYKARLVSDDGTSAFTYFEVLDVNVSYTLSDKVTVYFSSRNATPEFMSLGDVQECPYYCYLLKNYAERGYITVPKTMNYLKVHFRGKYGRVSNKSRKIFN